VIDGVLLRPFPFPSSERLVKVWETNAIRNFPKFPVAPANYFDWRKQNQVFSAMGAFQANAFNLASSESEPERYLGAVCDHGFFRNAGSDAGAGTNSSMKMRSDRAATAL